MEEEWEALMTLHGPSQKTGKRSLRRKMEGFRKCSNCGEAGKVKEWLFEDMDPLEGEREVPCSATTSSHKSTRLPVHWKLYKGRSYRMKSERSSALIDDKKSGSISIETISDNL
jgi:hypothetical protein